MGCQSVSEGTFFQAKRSHCRSSSSVLGGWIFVCRGSTSREFVDRSSFAIKFPNPWAPFLRVRRLFLFTAFQPLLVIYLHTVVLETLKL